MATHTVVINRNGADGNLTGSKTLTATGVIAIDETVAGSTTHKLVNIAFTIAQLASIWIYSDVALTLKTNSSSSPAETISLLAGKAYRWYTASYYTNLFGTDVTKIYLTNATGGTATVNIRVLVDPTP